MKINNNINEMGENMAVIVIISLIIYVIAIVTIYTNTYYLEKDKRIKFILIGLVITYIMTIFIVLISSSNVEIENKQYVAVANRISRLLFAPINSIMFLPYIGNVLNKYKNDALSGKQVRKRFIIIAIIAILIIFFEVDYIKNFETGLIQNATK